VRRFRSAPFLLRQWRARIADLKSGFATHAKFMEFQERFLHNTAPVVPPTPLVALADLFMKKLNGAGKMSKQALIDMAIKEGCGG
jgi:hypothetical protein